MSKPQIAFHRALGVVMLSVALFAAASASAQTAKPAAPPATAAAPTPLPIAVLWMQRVYHDSAAGKTATQELGELRARYQTEVAKGESKIRAEQDDLARQQPVLSADAFEEKRRAYQRDASDLQQLLQDRTAELDLKSKRITSQIDGALVKVLKPYMIERGISIVIDRQQVITMDQAIDITDDVLKELNKVLPAIKLSEGTPSKDSAAPKKAPAAH